MVLSVLSAMAFSHRGSDALTKVLLVHVGSWVAQFYGHGVHEHRAPALLDNLVGGEPTHRSLRRPGLMLSNIIATALVLAPFFVHLELLFAAGYRPAFHKRLQNEIGKEITAVRRAEAEKKRTKAKDL